MAIRKVNRSIHLAQPKRGVPDTPGFGVVGQKPQLPELMQVRANVYCTLGTMNTGLEQAVQGLETLVKIKYLSSDNLRSTLNQLSQLRAQLNRDLIAVLAERETANAAHFHQLCSVPEPQRNTA
ncbi:MAG TPA: hypothetical protein VIB39_19895 [Candidatus Angelobacter sp.]|jgi:hypothetical protein